MSNIDIIVLNGNETIDFAALELERYIRLISNDLCSISYCFEIQDRAAIYIGLSEDVKKVIQNVSKSEWDDEIWIQSHGSSLILAGSNYRSVLFSVYAFLQKLGVRWLYPGKEGEILPNLESIEFSGYAIHEKASLRHRGVVNEGACSIGQIIDFIDWMAKSKMNHFFLQFQSLDFFSGDMNLRLRMSR